MHKIIFKKITNKRQEYNIIFSCLEVNIRYPIYEKKFGKKGNNGQRPIANRLYLAKYERN